MKDPAKYKGYAGRVEKFLRDHQAYLEKNPKATEKGSDAEEQYNQWLAKNNVMLPPREMKLLEREQIAERARTETLKETDARFAEVHDDNFRRDTEPKIQKEADEFFAKLAQEAVPPDLAKLAKEKGIEEAKKAYPLEYRVAAEILTETASDVEELRRITTFNPKTGRALKAYDANNAQHDRILKFIRKTCDDFKNGQPDEAAAMKANRTKLQVQNGKTFLTRDDFFALKPEQRANHWTFSTEQIIVMAGISAKDSIAARIAREQSQRESEGWVRKPAAAATQAPPPNGAPPAMRPSPIPANGSAPEQPDRAFNLLMGEPM